MSETATSAEAMIRLAALVREVERVAGERYGGHYTVMKFTTHYKACWGTPDLYEGQQHPSEAPYWEVHALPAYPDLASALAGLLAEGWKLPAAPPAPPAPPPPPAITLEAARARWSDVLEAVRQVSASVAALLSGGAPAAVEPPNVLVLEFLYDFHRTRTQEAANRIVVEKALRRVFGVQLRVRCVGPTAAPGV